MTQLRSNIDVERTGSGAGADLTGFHSRSTDKDQLRRDISGRHSSLSQLPQQPSVAHTLRDVTRNEQRAVSVVATTSARAFSSPESDSRPASASSDPRVEQEDTRPWWRRALGRVTGAVRGVVEGAGNLIEAAQEVTQFLAEKAVDPESWRALGRACRDGANWLVEKACDVETWKSLGRGYISLMTLGPRVLAYAVMNPLESLKKVGSFLKNMSDSLGLTDLAVGIGRCCRGDFAGGLQALKGAGKLFLETTGIADLYGAVKHGGMALYCLAKGDRQAALAHFGQAVMHGAFAAMSIGSIAATVATGGVAAGAIVGVMMLRTTVKQAAKQVAETAVKEFFKQGGKEIGQKLVGEVAKDLTSETLQQTARESVDTGCRAVLNDVLGASGANKLLSPSTSPSVRSALEAKLAAGLSSDTFERVFKQVGLDSTDDLMKRADVAQRAEGLAREFIDNFRGLSKSERIKQLEASGLDPRSARTAAKQIDTLMNDTGHTAFYSPHQGSDFAAFQRDFDRWRGQADANRKAMDAKSFEILIQEIKKPLVERIAAEQKEVFYSQLRRTLTGQTDSPVGAALSKAVRRQADSLGKSADELADTYVESAWKGYRQGIEESVEKAIREGVEAARGKARPRVRMQFGRAGQNQGTSLSGEVDDVESVSGSPGKNAQAEVDVDTASTARRVVSHRTRQEGGRVFRDTLEQKVGEDRWVVVGTAQLSEETPLSPPPSQAVEAKGALAVVDRLFGVK